LLGHSRVGGQRGTFRPFSNRPSPNRACSWVGRQRVTPKGTFPTAPRRTTHDRFRITSLSSDLFRECWSVVASRMDGVVALPADDKRLSPSLCHDANPLRRGTPAFLGEIGELADVMDFNRVGAPAELAGLCEETLDNPTPSTPAGCYRIADGDPLVPAQCDPAEVRDEGWFVGATFHHDLQHPIGAVGGGSRAFVASEDGCPAGLELPGEGAGKRKFRHPFEGGQAVQVVGQAVVLHDADVFRLVLGHNAVGAVVDPLHQMDGFAVAQVFGAVGWQDMRWHPQADRAVDAALAALVMLVVRVQGVDVVAQKARVLCAGVGNDRLGVTQLQLEVLVKEGRKLLLDRLRFGFGTRKSDQIPVGDGACRRFPGSAEPASAGPNPAYTFRSTGLSRQHSAPCSRR
jgi:hypothetical protein